MKYLILLRLTIILLMGISFSELSYSQTTKIVAASCGKCGRSVHSTSSVGGTCPHCGARWGREIKSTNTSRELDYNTGRDTKTSSSESYRMELDLTQTSELVLPNNSNLGIPNTKLPTYSSLEMSTIIRNCKLRSSPSSKSEILGLLAKNSSIIIEKRKGDWLRITYYGNLEGEFGSYVGWIHSSNVVE